ncbi:hypothetical protein ON010_g16626 [Phytophthora cinnamomi]|nr:hypothetical protein ON010_g16626 [Phytophthora cinnamomi]
MIQAILKIDERISSRQSSLSHSRARDASRQRDDRRRDDSRSHERSEDTRRRDDRRRDDSRDVYNRRDRRERGYERRRYDSRNMLRVSLAEASVADIIAELHGRNMRDARSDLQHPRHQYNDVSNSEDGSEHGSDDSQCSGEDWGDSYSLDGSDDYLAAANDKGRRVAAEGTCAWSDNRQLRSDPAGRSQGRDNQLQSRGYRDEKSRRPPTTTGLVPIGLPQLVEPAIEAECIYSFVGKSEWTKNEQVNDVITTELEKERGRSLGEGVTSGEHDDEVIGDTADDSLISAVHGDMPRRLATAVRLLPGERMGWWSVQKSDKKALDETLLKWEAERYQQRLVKQQPIVDRPRYPTPRGILRRPEAAAKGQEGGNVDADDGSDNPDDSPVEDDSESAVQDHYQNLLATADDSAEVTNTEKDVAIFSEALEEDSSTSESTAHGGEEVQQANGPPEHASMTQTIPARAPDDSLTVPEQTFIATMCDKPNVPDSVFMYTEALATMPTTHAQAEVKKNQTRPRSKPLKAKPPWPTTQNNKSPPTI